MEQLVENGLDDDARVTLKNLLVRDDTLSELAALKQDAKNFGYQMMVTEREKRATLAPLYRIAKALLPQLAISQQNMEYYASLVHYYTIYDLRRIRSGQSNLYLLCYAWRRYRQITDNLIEAFGHHMRQIEQKTKEASEEAYSQAQTKQRQDGPSVGRLLLLYVDEAVDDATPFGLVRKQAFTIMPREALLTAGKRLSEKPTSQMELRWQEVNRFHKRTLRLSVDADAPATALCKDHRR